MDEIEEQEVGHEARGVATASRGAASARAQGSDVAAGEAPAAATSFGRQQSTQAVGGSRVRRLEEVENRSKWAVVTPQIH
jgi:hypothetical protein